MAFERKNCNKGMKNNKLGKLKITKRIFLFVLTLALTNCQDSENLTTQEQSTIKTVSINDAKAFLTRSTNSPSSKLSSSEISNLEFDKATLEKINGSDQLLTVIPFATNNEVRNDRVLVVKINDEIRSVIYSMQADEKLVQGFFSGKLFIYSLEGDFINGYRVKDGIIETQYVKSNSTTSSTSKTNIVDLKEVLVPRKPKLTNGTDWDAIWGSAGSSMGWSPVGGGGGMSWDSTGGGGAGSSSSTTAPIAIEKQIISDSLNNCPKEALEQLKKGTNASIAKILSKLGASKVFTVTIKSSSKVVRPASSTISSPNNYNIAVSTNYTSATSLFRASNLLHEIVHCYFFSLVDDYTAKNNPAIFNDFPTLFQKFVDKKYPGSKDSAHHDEMANSYVNAIGAALQEFQTGIAVKEGETPNQIYTDLAWGGLQEAPIFMQKFPVNSEEYKRIIGRYNGESTNSTINGQTPAGKPCNTK
ncbi:hypothetical protein [Flavobacterium pectinovorum]|uniref:Uncharacterized protein n=1 Tax=Flavobacterium pectinovorum TaxID=29533 RepID=A0A502F200_9FLAO|nr:hypothetical protein [Flavobacterium pectinovorum]TPG44053.1 hypothetical protein EAH81_05740 [Flavobacterium pectinovorum]